MIFHQPHNSLSNYTYNAFFYTSEVWNFHFHKNLELIYVIKGTLKCTINRNEYILKPGDYGLCLPYDIHACFPEPDTLYWICVFSEDHVRLFSNQIHKKSAKGFVFRCPESTHQFLQDALIHEDLPSIHLLKACLYAVCDAFLSQIELSDDVNSKKTNMIFITEYVAENHTKNISLKDISKLLNYDYNYVSRYFHSAFNMSFTDFLNVYRLETAVKMLEETEKKITDIALESGFQSVRSFNNSFRLKFGINPSEYKRTRYSKK